jgi:hypothetical protein
MADDIMNYSSCCSRATAIKVDWEDKGLVELLDIDYVLCDGRRVHVKECTNCPEHYMEEEEEGIPGELIQRWIAHYSFWRVMDNAEDYSNGGNSPQGSEE